MDRAQLVQQANGPERSPDSVGHRLQKQNRLRTID